MQFRTLGQSDLRVSTVGLGGNNYFLRLDVEGTRAVVYKALDLGITMFDVADKYGKRGGSEDYLGRVLGPRRKDIVLATKFGLAMDTEGKLKGASRKYIMYAIDASLKRLRTDWIDLYQIHKPDPDTPIAETLSALGDLIKQGKVRYIGCSNFSVPQLEEALATAKSLGLPAFVSCQDKYNLLERGVEHEMLPAIDKHKLGLLPYTPLGAGMLSGEYHANEPLPADGRLITLPGHRLLSDANFAIVEKLRVFCEARGRTMLELAFNWLLSHPSLTSVIAGAMKPKELEQNVRAADWVLSSEDLAEIDRITGKAAS